MRLERRSEEVSNANSADLLMGSTLHIGHLETDEGQLDSLLCEARSAIEQRRLSPVDAEEEVALTDAEAGIQILATIHPRLLQLH
jgi:hypothetical protein